MGLQQTPRPQRSPWVRYAPIIAIVVVVVIIVVALATRSSDDKKTTPKGGTTSTTVAHATLYNDAKSEGNTGKYTWQDHCDTTTGRVAIPILNPPPCVAKAAGANGGATSPGVTADTIKIGYYIAKPDPTLDPILQASGSYDPPDQTAKQYEAWASLYNSVYETYGRKVQMIRIDGTGSSNDAVAARADADRAAAQGVFAVLGGPLQAKQFGDELAQKHVLCVGQCIVAQPQKYLLDNSPYMWPTGPTPDETSAWVTELIKKQFLSGDATAKFGGSDQNGKKRTFTLLTYNTPDGQYTSSWDDLEAKIKASGANVVKHVDYYLNIATLQADARTIAAQLKQANATSIVFAGDPVFPRFLTDEMTKAGYFPEWIMSGTVLADTNNLARAFKTDQWKHAVGLQLIPARLPKVKQDSYLLAQWWYGTPPITENNFSILKGDVELLFDGLQLAGPNLTPASFKAGMDAAPPYTSGEPPTIRTIISYGDHGVWPDTADDPGGLDNVGLMWWDPTAVGPDETGKVAPGMYRLMSGGLRYTTGHLPSDPLPFFDPANTVTVYDENNVPDALKPPDVQSPPDAPKNKK